MAKEITTIKLQSASLDDKYGDIVAHGWLDIEALQNLKVGDYQREILDSRGGRKSSIRKAIDGGDRLPDIMLGMRGEKFTSRGEDMLLENDVYVIDGLQRVSALRKYAADVPQEATTIRIGAEVRFNTDRDKENELFTILNVNRRAMSPSVILRNQRNDFSGVATLYGLSLHDKNFAMVGKICWDQQMHRGELTTALSFAKVAVTLHRHLAVGGRNLSTSTSLPDVLENMVKGAGLQNFRYNVIAFYEAVDEIWGVRDIKYTDRAVHVRNTFLLQIAGLFSDHENFWQGNKLVVDKSQLAKLKGFPINDPTIIRLAGAGNAAGLLLYRHLIDHMNKGRSSDRHLVPRRLPQYKDRGSKKNKAAA